MDIDQLKKSEAQLALTLGRYQNNEEPKQMGTLAEEADLRINILQRGRSRLESEGYINVTRDYPATHMTLTEEGQELYQVLETLQDILQGAAPDAEKQSN